MPNLGDIVDIAQAMQAHAVEIRSNRCTVVRNRHSLCTKCIDSCPTSAIVIEKNVLSIDPQGCVGCGACITVCPTEALVSLAPNDGDLLDHIQKALILTKGVAVFACARIASKGIADPRRFSEVPCLARIEEGVLLYCASYGADDITLVDGGCKSCKYHATEKGIALTVASANNLFATQGSSLRVQRTSDVPPVALFQGEGGLLGHARRGFFNGAGLLVKDVAITAAEVMMQKHPGSDSPSLKDQLRVSEAGTLPQFSPTRHLGILDCMDEMGTPVKPYLDSRLFGSVAIDTNACSACGMCAVFCPTSALKKSDISPDHQGSLVLEFSAAECVQCNLCADSCMETCLSVNSLVASTELFDFEPRTFVLSKEQSSSSLFTSVLY